MAVIFKPSTRDKNGKGVDDDEEDKGRTHRGDDDGGHGGCAFRGVGLLMYSLFVRVGPG
jgi:hypothetical protein